MKNHLTWDEHHHSVGIARIDDEHRHIFELVNRINDALVSREQFESIGDTLEELLTFTKAHFAHEEQTMAKQAYPGTAAHAKEHRLLVEQINNLVESAQHYPSYFRTSLVTAFLTDWAELHILSDDRKLGDFLVAREKDL
ncbi:MAG: hemerythrin family protein [Sulfuricella sp.]|nr:hemerythrin family protein [Sulfuricella sp.]